MAGIMLDDVKRKLAINNPILQNQAFAKLLNCIRTKLLADKSESGGVLQGKTRNFPELDFVWERCIDPSPSVSNGMCNILISLAVLDQADVRYVLDGLLNHVPHARNIGSLIMAINDILMLGKIQQRFNLRNPVHPFITVLQCKPMFWSHVFEQITQSFATDASVSKEAVFATMRPALQYIMYDPCRPDNLFELRVSLFKMLTPKCIYVDDSVHLLEFLLRSMYFMKLENDGCCMEAASRLQDISSLLLAISEENDCTKAWTDHLLLYALSLCISMNRLNLGISSSLFIVEHLAERLCKFQLTIERYSAILLLASLLMEVTPQHQLHIIRICFILINNDVCQWNYMICSFLFFPLITILSAPPLERQISFETNCVNFLSNPQQQAAKLLRRVESSKQQKVLFDHLPLNVIPVIPLHVSNFSTDLAEALQLSRMVLRFQLNDSHAVLVQWLQHVKRTFLTGMEFNFQLLCVLCSIAIQCNDSVVIQECLDLIASSSERSVNHGASLFAVLLYMLKLKRENQHHVRLHICNVLPRFAVHKSCIAPIVNIIHHLEIIPGLQAVSVRLMCSLWLRQDRVFPQLNKFLVNIPNKGSRDSLFKEITLAKVASIFDVCKMKPDQHGADLLTVLSKIIILDDSEAIGSVITALGIDSIRVLCEHDIIDLKTTWLFLKRVVGNDKRPLVVEKVCGLLSLAESLKRNSLDGENFISEVVDTLWCYVTQSDEPLIVASAYEALSHFNNMRHRLQYLPKELTNKTTLSLDKESSDSNHQNELQYVPGSCFLDLLLSIRSLKVLIPNFQKFFVKLVIREVEELPRDVLHKSKLISERKNKLKFKKSPVFKEAKKLFSEQNFYGSSFGLKNSFAFGLLFAWEPSDVALKKDSHSTSQYYLKWSNSYTKMLEVLLFHTELDIKDWRRALLYTSAWSSFMERAYFATVQARFAQLDLHANQDDQNYEDLEKIQDNVWLWARDKLAASLREASRGKVSAHGNAIIGLAGLAATIVKHSDNCNTRTSDVLGSPQIMHGQPMVGSEHLSHKHWLHEIIQAFIKVLSPLDEPTGGPFSWCYSVCAQNIPNQAFTALAFVILAEALVICQTDIIQEILNLFLVRLAEPQTMDLTRFSLGLGLGLLLAGLISHHFLDIADAVAKQMVLRAAAELKSWCFTSDFDSRAGGILGLAIFSSTMAREDDAEIQEFSHLSGTEFIGKLYETISLPVIDEFLCYGASLIASSMCVKDQQHLGQAEDLMITLLELSAKPENGNRIAGALGVLAAALGHSGHRTHTEKHEVLLREFLSTLSDEKAPSSWRLSALHGAHSTVPGSFEQNLIHGFQTDLSRLKGTPSNDLMETLCRLAASTDSTALKGKCIWMLGESIWNIEQAEETANEMYCNISYLGDKSLLKSIIKFIQDFITMGQKIELHSHLLVCLRALGQETSRPYPAINWSSILKPILHYSPEVEECCVDIAIKRSLSSPSAAALVKSLLIGSGSHHLKEMSRVKLYSGLPIVIRCIAAGAFHNFLEENAQLIFEQKSTSLCTAEAFLKGIVEALKVLDPPAGISRVLYISMAHIFQFISPKDKAIWCVFCEAAQELPDEILNQMTVLTTDNCLKMLIFSGSFVASRNQPLTSLNRYIDIVIVSVTEPEDREKLMAILLDCFRCSIALERQTKECDSSTRVNWILELMGHFQNVMQQRSTSAFDKGENMLQQVSLNLFIVFGAAVLSWSQSRFQYYCFMQLNNDNVSNMLLGILPTTLKHLVCDEVWKPHIQKIAEWLIAISRRSFVGDIVKQSAKNCLLNMRECEEFKRPSIWTRTVELMDM